MSDKDFGSNSFVADTASENNEDYIVPDTAVKLDQILGSLQMIRQRHKMGPDNRWVQLFHALLRKYPQSGPCPVCGFK